MSKNNVMVIAGVYDARSEIKYSYNNENPFYAHYLDAAAAARPGETAFNTVNENFTHTVLVDVATDTKCPICPIMEEALYNLYKQGSILFILSIWYVIKISMHLGLCLIIRKGIIRL